MQSGFGLVSCCFCCSDIDIASGV